MLVVVCVGGGCECVWCVLVVVVNVCGVCWW